MTSSLLDYAQEATRTHVHRVTNLYPTPPYVKSASEAQLYGDDSLPPGAHGHPTKKLYRVHTKAATWLSCASFGENKGKFHPGEAAAVERNLVKAATWHGILPDVQALWAKIAEASDTRRDLPDDHYMYLGYTPEGHVRTRRYPLRNQAEVKVAADYFLTHRFKFPFTERQSMALRVLNRADDLHLKLAQEEVLCKSAGFGACTREEVRMAWLKRANAVKDSHREWAMEAADLANMVKSSSLAYDAECRVKMAEVMEKFDKETGIDSLYGHGLERPEDVLFQISEKVAKDFLATHVQTTTGKIYAKESLAKLTPEGLRQWLGNDADAMLAGGVLIDTEKLAKCLHSMPRPDAFLFDELASAHGIKPVGTEKEAADFGFSEAQLRELAGSAG